MRNIIKIFLLTVAPLLTACETDSYRTGDGALSAMRAEFVEAHTDVDARVMAVETDGGERLTLTSPVAVVWMEKPDTVYRALFYYNKVDGDGGQPQAEPVAVSYVLVPSVTAAAGMTGDMKTDPVKFVSSWASANGKYLNIELLLMTGKVDGDNAAQTVGVICDSVTTGGDGARRMWCTLYHDQNGVPEYYSSQTYVSIPVVGLPVAPAQGDEVILDINTYDGKITRTFGF